MKDSKFVALKKQRVAPILSDTALFPFKFELKFHFNETMNAIRRITHIRNAIFFLKPFIKILLCAFIFPNELELLDHAHAGAPFKRILVK